MLTKFDRTIQRIEYYLHSIFNVFIWCLLMIVGVGSAMFIYVNIGPGPFTFLAGFFIFMMALVARR